MPQFCVQLGGIVPGRYLRQERKSRRDDLEVQPPSLVKIRAFAGEQVQPLTGGAKPYLWY